MERRQLLASIGTGAAAGLVGCLGSGDGGDGGAEYPDQEVNITIPWSEGGGTDIYVRQLAPAMGRVAGVDFIIENVPGAGSARGTGQFVTSAEPTGYEILANNIPPMIGPVLETQPSWAPDFPGLRGIYTYGVNAVIVISHPDSAQTIEEFFEMAATDEINQVSTTGPGSVGMAITNLITNDTEQYGLEPGDLDWVPYESGGEAVRAVVQGEVPASIVTGTAAAEQYDGENFNPLASCSSQGMSQFPDMPTWEDIGYENIDFIGQVNRQLWFPEGTADDHVNAMAEIVEGALDDEEFQSWAEETGNPLARIGPDETDTIMQSAVEMYPDIFEAERPEGW